MGRVDPSSIKNEARLYRNGDYRAHAVAWAQLDKILVWLSQFPDFPLPNSDEEYKEYVRFKFNFIAYLYKKHATEQLIGAPIDVEIFRPR